MKRGFILWATLSGCVLLLPWCAGCSKKEEAPEAGEPEKAEQASERSSGTSLFTAPVDYLHVTTIEAPRHAKKTLFQANLRKQIQTFWAEKARYPESLEELEQYRGVALPELPKGMAYHYDPDTAELNIKETPQQ